MYFRRRFYILVVSGLSSYTTEQRLSEAFSQYGQVVEAKIAMDRVSDRSKGFGFVTFASEDEAEKAIAEMNGKALNGRVIFVDYAKLKTSFGGGMAEARGPPEPTANK
ncbi:small RNA-binding protein 11, chloroplastic-like [Alnus glutinosa]|uniref:small RNA-binding protein 11, chloroplastic-like n=1 Tax=Alnus glutinosa TaxID=3517 RepID=UPI002D785D22|nr:small RNA-binding protein 11, chloroplastic-like [Alnus glutinosa]